MCYNSEIYGRNNLVEKKREKNYLVESKMCLKIPLSRAGLNTSHATDVHQKIAVSVRVKYDNARVGLS